MVTTKKENGMMNAVPDGWPVQPRTVGDPFGPPV